MTTQAIPISAEISFATDDLSTSPLWNPDLAPTTPRQRTWSVWSIAALWISMSACIPTYMLASGLISEGMNWYQAVLTIFLGNVIVLIPMILNAHAGTKYGIPFPVYCRASFGTWGANVPALLRAFVACGWFGIQTWIGGAAIYSIMLAFMGKEHAAKPMPFLGINGWQLLCFLIFWAINVLVIYRGIETIRLLLNIKAPLLIALGLLFLWWAYQRAGGFGEMLSRPSQFAAGQPKAGQFWVAFVPLLTGMVGFWATLSLNIPDFSRYARSQRDQIIGQAVGLPTTMALYSFIGVAVTSATTVIFRNPDGSPGEPMWDPVQVLTRMDNKPALIISMLAICIATLATNIAANVVSPANDFAHLAPRMITFRVGGIITALIGVLIMPWKLLETSHGYIINWLVAYSALLGAVGGILICDYWVLRRTKLSVPDLFDPRGRYSYLNGTNWRAVGALILAIAPCVPGFVIQLIDPKATGFFPRLYTYAWFLTFFLAFVLYFVFMMGSRNMKEEV